ncbi:Soluble lytic murein transglycosylase and related regulatory proteins (some contain LysM/invasin domains) [Olavius sp. associated proteobacterium Delta 1]|nr:Soluble lytic murein transglycosylase and related regulatory proteins (some contain LysM/invasin domains) [Olavius sp. associated proteobacterium Delta 1]
MTTGNHLTVKDYFDQVLFGNTANRKAYSAKKAASSGTNRFHQLLTSYGNKQVNSNNYKPTGLKVADYLNNPVRAKCHYNYRVLPTSTEKKDAAVDKAPPAPSNRAAEDSAHKTIARSGVNRKPRQMITPAASTASPNQTGSSEKGMIEESIHKAAQKYNLPTGLIRAVIRAESNFEVTAVSRAGAQGLMQLMPGTAKELGVTNPFDIEQNIDGGTRYLRKMLDSFDGDLKVALAAYNAGPAAVEKYGGQIPPYQETEKYIARVLRFSKKMA